MRRKSSFLSVFFHERTVVISGDIMIFEDCEEIGKDFPRVSLVLESRIKHNQTDFSFDVYQMPFFSEGHFVRYRFRQLLLFENFCLAYFQTNVCAYLDEVLTIFCIEYFLISSSTLFFQQPLKFSVSERKSSVVTRTILILASHNFKYSIAESTEAISAISTNLLLCSRRVETFDCTLRSNSLIEWLDLVFGLSCLVLIQFYVTGVKI